jgi:receptor protein-tyrosine kinase
MNNSIESVTLAEAVVKRMSSPAWLPRWRSTEGAPQGPNHVGLLEPLTPASERIKSKGFEAKQAPSPSAEEQVDAMQLLRAQLALRWFNTGERRALTIVRPDARDTRLSIAVRLATACALAGDKTLLIDANLRTPTVCSMLGIETPLGLTSVLAGDVSLRQAVFPTGFTGLSALTSGPAAMRPETLLSKSRLKHVIEEAEKEYDIVIVDTPGMSAYADALIVADVIRGALVTVRRHQTRALDLGHAGTELRSAGVAIVGAVFTDV